MAATFEEKLEALRKIRERQLAKKAQQEDAGAAGASKELPTVEPPKDEQPEKGEVPSSDIDALFCTAHCYERGIHGCDKNLPTALQLYRHAAEQGHTVSQWRLGELLESGLCGDIEPNPREAQKWYTLAAENGNAQAQNALALMLEDGQDGVPQDTEAALKWHLAAAEQGNALSQFCSASMLSKMGQDEVAMTWLQKSAAQGFGPAEQVLEDMDAPKTRDTTDTNDLLSLANRVVEQLGSLGDIEAEELLDELLHECHPISLDAGALGEIEISDDDPELEVEDLTQ